MYAHTFKDADGNVFTWKTQNGVGLNVGDSVNVKGTIKAHTEYKEEKQTELTRCKVTAA
jgi:predicted extracellular nuclease